jgi:hypothetical protein
MFLPSREHPLTWGSACLGEDTEILLADGTFASLLHSIGQAIWTDKQGTRRIKRIHKFATLATDPHLYEVGGNWMTASISLHAFRTREEMVSGLRNPREYHTE